MRKLCYILVISLIAWGCAQPPNPDSRVDENTGPSAIHQDTSLENVTSTVEVQKSTTAQDSANVVKPLTKWQQDSIRKWKDGYAKDIPGKAVSTKTDFLVKPVPGQPYDTALYNRQAPLREQKK